MDKKIKICFIANKANLSGAAKSLWQILKYINKEKFECVVIINNIGDGLFKLIPYAKCYYFVTKRYKFRYTYRVRKTISSLFEKTWFQYKIKKINPDIIYFNTNISYQYMSWAKELIDNGVIHAKVVCHIHGQHQGITYSLMTPDGNVPMNSAILHVTKTVPNHYIACACASKKVLIQKLSIPESAITVARVSIDLEELYTYTSSLTKESLGWNKKIVIGVVGNFSYGKGADIFIEAIHMLRKEYTENNLLFVWLGTDVESNSIRKPFSTDFSRKCIDKMKFYGIENEINLMGHQSDIYKYIRLLDVFALPTRDECIPTVILEAMALKIPVVASAVSGIPEVINESNGILTDVNPQSFAQGLLAAIQFHQLKNNVRIENASQDVKKFDAKLQVIKIENCVKQLLE
jgi:glycosyltransferase involved in cell wall biosynthesis